MLLLFATSVTMAVARGQVRDGTTNKIVICSGYGLTTIYVDENGKEVPKVHICPDCVLAMLAALGVEPPVIFRPETRAAQLVPLEVPRLQSRPSCRYCARDPPALA